MDDDVLDVLGSTRIIEDYETAEKLRVEDVNASKPLLQDIHVSAPPVISPNSDPKTVNHAIPSPTSSKKRKDDNTFEKESKKQKPQGPSIQRAIKGKAGEQELCPECKSLHRKAGIDVITCPAYFYSREYSAKVPRGKVPSSKAWKRIWPLVKHHFRRW